MPLFTGAIGYVTNWSGVWMLFYPVRFRGVRIPGVAPLVHIMPRRIKQIPGIMQGGVGWQGIIPSRAAKMGSISVDKGIAKLGSPAEFYKQLDPEKLAEHMITAAQRDMREVVERIIRRENPRLWEEMGPELQDRVHARVQEQLPDIVRMITDEIGENIDQLLDVKLMVIRRIEAEPELANEIYLEVGRRELKLIVNFGFLFGFLLGIPTAIVTELLFHQWWLLPIAGILIGYVTNLVAIKMIFEPIEPRRYFGVLVHGLFLRRQDEVADIYAKIIAERIVTLSNIGDELLNGPSSDRTRQMIETAMRPAVDQAVGRAKPAVRVAVGTREYDAIRESVAAEAVEYTMTPLADEKINREQSVAVQRLIAERMREMPSRDFSEMLRTVMREDEWLLYLHGAVLGLFGGLLHLAIFG
ncbi:MAG: hypothetical protein H0V29_08740 [Thermoleophilaceae bacterium]|nr:hypothetical protein [Thermoleophilaceae bacterium]